MFIFAVLRAADKALHALKGMKRGMSGDKHKALKRWSSTSKKRSKCAWKHRFVCLGYYGQPKIPTTDTDKDELLVLDKSESTHIYPQLPSMDEMIPPLPPNVKDYRTR